MPPKKSPTKKPKKKEEEDIPDIEIEETERIDDVEDVDEEEEPPLDDEEEEEDLTFLDEEEKEGLIEKEGAIDEKECTIEKAIEDDNEYFENEEEEIEVQPDTTVQYVKKEDRVSAPKLTKYEMVRILGERSKQLTTGAKPLIKNYKGLPYDKIAEEELKLNMIPFKIRRPLPNGKYELWTLDELKKDHLLSLLEE